MQARKHLGQHFLADGNVIRKIIDAIGPQPGQHFVEIGPGRGAITLPLLAAGVRLDVIEIDRDLARELPALVNSPLCTVHGANGNAGNERRRGDRLPQLSGRMPGGAGLRGASERRTRTDCGRHAGKTGRACGAPRAPRDRE